MRRVIAIETNAPTETATITGAEKPSPAERARREKLKRRPMIAGGRARALPV